MGIFYRLNLALFAMSIVSVANASSWVYMERIDGFSDKDSSFIRLSDRTVKKIIMPRRSAAHLVLKCLDSGLGMFAMHGYMGGDINNDVSVQLRIDKNTPYGPEYWSLAAGSKASFAPDKDLNNLILQMIKGNKLLIRVRDLADGESVTTEIPLDGFSAAYNQLSCRI